MRSSRRGVVLDRAPFRPTSIGNGSCAFWLRGDFVGLADATAMDTWSDQSGSANDATQSTSGYRPIVKKAIANGHDIVRFDILDDRMVTPVSIVSPTPFTIIAVYARTSAEFNVHRTIQGSNNWLIGPYNDTNRCYNGGFLTGNVFVPGVFDIVTVTQVSGKASLYINGTLWETNSAGTWPGTIGLGAQGAYAESALSDVAEIIIWKGYAFTPRDVSFSNRALGQKYGISAV